MKRFDRATYVIFLLVLLADVARAHTSVPIGNGEGGGFILSAASQLQVSPTGEALLAFRRSDSATPRIAGFRSCKLSFFRWPGAFSDRSNRTARWSYSSAVMMPVLASTPGEEPGYSFIASQRPASPSRSIFRHTASPAP